MFLEFSDKAKDLQKQLRAFMDKHIYPNEPEFFRQLNEGERWKVIPLLEDLKEKAKAEGLWNLFLPESEYGAGLTNFEYAPLCEIMGRTYWASEVFNCSAPDTGNMEVLVRYGTEEQKERWLKPLLEAKIRSAFCMTEPQVASSDARNIEAAIVRDGDVVVTQGAGDITRLAQLLAANKRAADGRALGQAVFEGTEGRVPPLPGPAKGLLPLTERTVKRRSPLA